jgi:hypothetical protein
MDGWMDGWMDRRHCILAGIEVFGDPEVDHSFCL